MSETKHTLGLVAYVERQDDHLTCWVGNKAMERAAVMHTGPSITEENAIANAYLFAGASDLLAACKKALTTLDVGCHPDTGEPFKEECDVLRAAAAKARPDVP